MTSLNSIREIIYYIMEKLLQWIYATRNKKSIYKISVSLFVIGIFIFGISSLLYMLGMIVLIAGHKNQNNINFFSIAGIITCIISLIFLSNLRVKKCEYSRIMLSYFFLITKLKNIEKDDIEIKWFKIVGMVVISCILMQLIAGELDYWSLIFNISFGNLIVFGLMIIGIIIYISITEFIFDEVMYYKTQSIGSLVLFVVMYILSIKSFGHISEDDQNTIPTILIFAIGQIAFIVGAISSHKNMIKFLKSTYKVELEEYLRETDISYEQKIIQINEGVIAAKNGTEELKEIWKNMTYKQRIKIVLLIIGFIVFNILFLFSGKLSIPMR